MRSQTTPSTLSSATFSTSWFLIQMLGYEVSLSFLPLYAGALPLSSATPTAHSPAPALITHTPQLLTSLIPFAQTIKCDRNIQC